MALSTGTRTRPKFPASAIHAVAIRFAAWPLALCIVAACGTEKARRTGDTSGGSEDRRIVVYNAGSLALPLRAALDSFAAREHITVEQENAGSLETARKLTELGKIPDLVAVADYEVIPLLLIPSHATETSKRAGVKPLTGESHINDAGAGCNDVAAIPNENSVVI